MAKHDILQPDLHQAQRYLDILQLDGTFTFQTFSDKKEPGRKGDPLARVLHGSLAEHAAELTRLNQQGAGVFVMINEGDGVVHEGFATCRTKANVIAVRAVFADLDGAPLDPILEVMPADLIIESSPGKYHVYWLAQGMPIEMFTPVQKAIAEKFSSDPKVIDLPRVLRLPGFWHQKAKPFLVYIFKEFNV